MNGNDIPQYSDAAQDYLDALPFKYNMVELSGAIAKKLNLRELYKNNGGVVLDNGYIVGIYPYTSTDYEIQQMLDLKTYLVEKDIGLLYVNQPTKYVDDNIIAESVGVKTYINDNADRFLERLGENEIRYIDLRDIIEEQDLNSFELFYKTDHHWTPEAGKMAAEIIAKEFNSNYNYGIDLSLYDSEKFLYTEYKEAWLGEQGRKIGASFVGVGDFTLILPEYETSFDVIRKGRSFSGSFGEALVNQDYYTPEMNEEIYKAPNWYYSYMTDVNGTIVKNNLNEQGKRVLVLGDSYAQVTVPFLALGVSEVHTLIRRNYAGDLKEYIDNHNIDTVVIAYVAFMIGAHDNENSANYKMFSFQ